ncbi:hypothetical protein NDU88_001533 [Pleurodeles waltl]|uniref:Uncharacterized protein n=1 Tax=Pleurodeles waltl TaxID=8319 RepID=A0AAV7U7A3_PLEWA|nr:hypothetical protein NDU88_001532 [Pleurodeles waltl]KAJ1184730.1 hypothetical protein NDU88_001533 [Pleurodeles waltl]
MASPGAQPAPQSHVAFRSRACAPDSPKASHLSVREDRHSHMVSSSNYFTFVAAASDLDPPRFQAAQSRHLCIGLRGGNRRRPDHSIPLTLLRCPEGAGDE